MDQSPINRHSRVGGFAAYAHVRGTVRGTTLDDDDELGGGKQAKPFFELNPWHGFGGTDTTVYNGNIPVAIPYGNTDIEAAVGITSQASDSVSLSARVGYLTSIDGNFQKAYKGQIGLRYAW